MVHHNVVEHLPEQSRHELGRRYMLENAPERAKLRLWGTASVYGISSGYCCQVYDITTGSLVSYPHPYRVLQLHQDDQGRNWLQIESHRVESVPNWLTLQQLSRQWMGDRSLPSCSSSYPGTLKPAPNRQRRWLPV